MLNNEKLVRAIYNAIDEINEQFPEEQKLTKSTDTVLFGESGKLDSLGLVDLIVATEQQLEEMCDVILILADERALSQKRSPFRTVDSLTNYIKMLLEEESND